MTSRAAHLDISALSPAEYEAYEPWAALIDTKVGKVSPERMLELVSKACGKTYNEARQEEILSFFEPRPPVLTTGAFLAILRLVAHARTCSVLCRDHVFVQCTPLRLTPASLGNEEAVGGQRSTSNPYHKRVVSEGDHSEASSNPFRPRVSDTPALSNATSSYLSRTPSTAQASTIIPPLPPRPSKASSLPPQPPLRMNLVPPPRDSSRNVGAVASTFEVIATSLAAPTPRRPRISPSALLGSTSTSYFGDRPVPPPVLPKPKLVSSTHIGPATRMRPVTPTAPPMSDSLSMERVSSMHIIRAPSLSSSSSSSDEDEPPVEPAPMMTRRASKDRPPPPPKRRVSNPASTSVPPLAHSAIGRSQSVRQRPSSVIVNAGGRPLESFDLKETASDWYEKAKRRATMPALNGDRKSLLADREEMGQAESDDLDDEDEDLPSSKPAWTRLP